MEHRLSKTVRGRVARAVKCRTKGHLTDGSEIVERLHGLGDWHVVQPYSMMNSPLCVAVDPILLHIT